MSIVLEFESGGTQDVRRPGGGVCEAGYLIESEGCVSESIKHRSRIFPVCLASWAVVGSKLRGDSATQRSIRSAA